MDEIETMFGSSYDDAAISALNGIHFYKNGTSVPSASGGIFITERDSDTNTLDKTWKEIYDAVSAKIPSFLFLTDSDGSYMYFIDEVYSGDGVYTVQTAIEEIYVTDSENGYPSFDDGEGGGGGGDL